MAGPQIVVGKTNIFPFILVLVTASIISASGYIVLDRSLERGPIVEGVKFEDIDLSGMTPEAAERRIARYNEKTISAPVYLKHSGMVWIMDPKKLGIALNTETILRQACSKGRTGGLIQKLKERRRLRSHPVAISPLITVDEGKLRDYMFNLSQVINVDPQNAELVVKPGDIIDVLPSISGLRLDTGDTINKIREVLLKRSDRSIALKVDIIDPPITTEKVKAMGVRRVIASYSTQFKPSDVNRSHNLAKGVKAIDEVIIAPGEVFSFNKTVGPRGANDGYKEAPVIIDGEIASGLGGGICQVSSTLFNAALYADMGVVARSNHSLASTYVPLGRDATVVYDYIDLKLKNTLECHLLIKSYISGNTLTVKIFGDAPMDKVVEVESRILGKISPGVIEKRDMSLAPGQRKTEKDGKPGYKVELIRRVKIGDKIVKEEKIGRSIYKATSSVVRVGPESQQ